LALLQENSGTEVAKLPDMVYTILLMEKEATKRPGAPGTEQMNPLAIIDIAGDEGGFVSGNADLKVVEKLYLPLFVG
jgi:hypothetical protein